jgi:hypothetical protein
VHRQGMRAYQDLDTHQCFTRRQPPHNIILLIISLSYEYSAHPAYLRFQPAEMTFSFRKANHLCLEGRTVARPNAETIFPWYRVLWTLMNVSPHNVVRNSYTCAQQRCLGDERRRP